jgi:hypothetical protein
MKVLKWFDTQEIDELARWMVAELVVRIPPAALASHEKKAASRLRNAHEAVFARAGKLSRSHKLNVYKKARFGNQFRWGLRDAGYPPEFVESWTQDLITVITTGQKAGQSSGSRSRSGR